MTGFPVHGGKGSAHHYVTNMATSAGTSFLTVILVLRQWWTRLQRYVEQHPPSICFYLLSKGTFRIQQSLWFLLTVGSKVRVHNGEPHDTVNLTSYL